MRAKKSKPMPADWSRDVAHYAQSWIGNSADDHKARNILGLAWDFGLTGPLKAILTRKDLTPAQAVRLWMLMGAFRIVNRKIEGWAWTSAGRCSGRPA